MTKITVFAFENYYPNGGINDLLGVYDSLSSAKRQAKKLIDKNNKYFDGTIQFCEGNNIIEKILYESDASKSLNINVYKDTGPRQEPMLNAEGKWEFPNLYTGLKK